MEDTEERRKLISNIERGLNYGIRKDDKVRHTESKEDVDCPTKRNMPCLWKGLNKN
jgi:hypothetical protein